MVGIAKARCLYGSSPDCSFPCNCAIQTDTECDQECPSGCANIPGDFNIKWRGPGCQIGNIAYNKATDGFSISNEPAETYSSSLAVDGKPQSAEGSGSLVSHNFCAHLERHKINNSTNPAYWLVDMGAAMSVQSVTLSGLSRCNDTDSRCNERFADFSIAVGDGAAFQYIDDPNHGTQCGRYDGVVPQGQAVNFTCPTTLTGHVVYFRRKKNHDGYEPGRCDLCEVIVFGYTPYDCTGITCHDGVACSDVNGCASCLGSYRPDCKTVCDANSYGINCKESCEGFMCKDGSATCNKENGNCPNGCIDWWLDDQCTTHVAPPDVTDETLRTPSDSVTNISVVLEWDSLTHVSPDLNQYYRYQVRYKDADDTTYKDGESVQHTAGVLSSTVTGLAHNTDYDFLVDTYRVMDGKEEKGESYPVMNVKTDCIAPDPPTIAVEAKNGSETANGPIIVIFTLPTGPNIGCDTITQVEVEYKHESENDFTEEQADVSNTISIYTITNTQHGVYEVRVEVINNEAYRVTSSSEKVTVVQTIVEPGSDTAVIALAVVVGLLVVVIIVIGVLLYFSKRRPKKPSKDLELPVCMETVSGSTSTEYQEFTNREVVSANEYDSINKEAKYKLKEQHSEYEDVQ